MLQTFKRILTYRRSPGEAALAFFLALGFAFMTCDVFAIKGSQLRQLGLPAPSPWLPFAAAGLFYVVYFLIRNKIGFLALLLFLLGFPGLMRVLVSSMDAQTTRIPIPRFIEGERCDALAQKLDFPFVQISSSGEGTCLLVRRNETEAAAARAAIAELQLEPFRRFPPLQPPPPAPVSGRGGIEPSTSPSSKP